MANTETTTWNLMKFLYFVENNIFKVYQISYSGLIITMVQKNPGVEPLV